MDSVEKIEKNGSGPPPPKKTQLGAVEYVLAMYTVFSLEIIAMQWHHPEQYK